MASNRLEVLLVGDARQLNQTFKETSKAADDMVGELVAKSSQAALGLSAITSAGGALISGFVSKASEMESFEAQLTGLTGDAALARQKLQEMADFAATTPFDLPGVVRAGNVLTGLKLNVEQNLPLIGGLASIMRRDLSEAALIWGKSMNGSRDGLQSLIDAGIVTKDRLKELGAAVESDGAIAVEGAANVEKLQGALQKLAEEKNFTGVMEQSGKTLEAALSSMNDAIGQVQASIGEGLTPIIKDGAEAVTGMLNAVRTLDPGLRTFIGTGILAGTIITGMAAAGAALTAVILPASVMWTAYTTTAQAAAATTLQNSVANLAAASSLQTQTAAEVEAAAALVVEANAAVANAATKEAGILAAEALAIAETELAAATEAAAVANASYEASAAGVIAAQTGQAAASTGLIGKLGALVTGGLGPLIILLGLAAAALAGYTAYIESTTAAQEKQLAVGERQVRHMHEAKEVTLAAAEAVKVWGDNTAAAADQVNTALDKIGANDLDVTKSMASNMMVLRGLYEQLEEARDAGEDTEALEKQIKTYEQRNEVLRQARHERRGMYQEQQEQAKQAQDASKKEQEAIEALLKRYKEKSSRGVYESNKEELTALDEVIGRIGKQHKDYQELADKRIKLSRDVAKDETKAGEDAQKEREKQRKDAFDLETHQIDLIVGNEQAAIQKRIALLQNLLLPGSKASAEERLRLETDLARETESLEKAKVAAAKKAEEEKKKAAEESAKAREQAAEAELKTAESTLSITRAKFDQGEATLEQLKQEIAARDSLAEKLEKEKAAAAGIGKSASTRAALQKSADAEIAASKAKSQLEIDKLEREAGKRKAQERAADKDEAAKSKSADEAREKARFDAGAANEDKLKAAMRDRQKAELEAMVARARAQEAAAQTAAEKARIRRGLETDLKDLTTKQVEEQRKLTEELEKQKQLTQEKKDGFSLGGISGVEGAGNFDAFAITKKAGDKKKLDQVVKDQAKADAAAAEALGKSAKNAGDATRAQIVAIDNQIKELEGKDATKENVAKLDELRTKRAELAKAKDKPPASEDKATAKTEDKKGGFISDDQAKAAAEKFEKAENQSPKPEDKSKEKKPDTTPATAELIAKTVTEISAKLDRILAEQQKPVDVKISGGGGGPYAGGASTAKPDWRTTPTKTGD